jgi:transposase
VIAPDFKTIANFRRDNGPAIRAVCGRFIELCRRLNLFTKAVVAIDCSKFKAANNRDKLRSDQDLFLGQRTMSTRHVGVNT